MEISYAPQPLEANVFSQVPGQNTIDAINDGTFESTSDSVMWAEDETVTLNIEFDQDVTISDIILKAWFATSSSKGKIFQLDTLKVLASSDGFADDIRTIVDFDDNEMHGNWGAPGHAPHDYEFENIDATAKSLRMVLTPRDETGIYIAELMIWGEAEGLEAVPMSGGQAVETFRALHAADIDGDGSDEIVAGSKGGKVYCLEDGTVRWTFDAHTSVESVNVANLDGEGTPAVIAGGLQSTLYTLTPGGEKLWEYELPQYKRTPNIRTVFPADLDGDGEDEVIAGADSWRYYAFDGDGTKLWQYETIHASTVGTATDMDGDDADEVIAATEYYLWHCIDGDGSGIWRYHSRSGSGPHCNALDTGDINGDGTPEVVFAGADANVHVVSEGKLMWAFNTGDEVTGVAVQNVQGDDTPEILATSLSFNAYCLDAEGNVIWRTDVMTPIVDMTFMRSDDADYLAVGCSDGAIYLLNADDGEIAARFQTRGEILAMTTATVEGQELLIASSTDGYAYAITAPQ
ncbi:MAG: PQQ-binding-like beta-propeller repeat protein [Armatimonadota bacterium]